MRVGETWQSKPEFYSVNVKIIRINEKNVVVLRHITSKFGAKGSIEQVIFKEVFIQNFKRIRIL